MNKINWLLESRLSAVKKRAEQYAKHYPDNAYKSALEWQVKLGRKGWIKYDSANTYDEAGNLCAYNLDKFDVTPIDKVSRNFDYTGYYADSFQHELIRAYVVKIKTSRGVYYCPAVDYSESDCATVYLSRAELVEKSASEDDHDSAKRTAAYTADRKAELLAEQCREDDAKYQAEDQIAGLQMENKQALKDAHDLLAEIRLQRDAGRIRSGICRVLIDKVKEYRAEIRRNNRRIQKLSENFWEAVA